MFSRIRRLAVAPVLALSLTLASSALAGGTVKPSRTELTEISGGWKVFLEVKLSKKPATAHQPFRFIFKRTVLYETYLDDAHGDAEQTRSIPTPDAAEQIESMDVGFGDAKGAIWDTTKLDFTIRRDRGYEAGEYKVEVRDGDNKLVGSAFTLKLSGKNTVIDRRAIVMADPSKKKKAEPKPEDKPKDDAKKDDKKDEPTGAGGGGDDTPDPKKAAAPPPATPPKKSGCGCEVPASSSLSGAGLLGLGLCAAAVRRRRRVG